MRTPRRRLAAGAAIAAVALGALAQPAWAQPGLQGVPKRAPVVVGPTASGASLVAFDEGRSLCLGLREGRFRGESSVGCGRPSFDLRSPALASSFGSGRRGSRHFGTVAPEVAALELVFRGGQSVRVDTSAGEAYRGRYAGRLRFFLAEFSRKSPGPRYVREFAADGSLLAVVDTTYFGVRVGRQATVAHGRLGSQRWALRAFQRRVLAPLPREPERFKTDTCVGIPASRRSPPYYPRTRAETCIDSDRPFQDLAVGTDSSCRGLGAVVTGLARDGIARVTAVLGSGQRRRLQLHRLPQRFGEVRAFLLVLPPSVAIRRVAGFSAEGARVDGTELALAPGVSQCRDDEGVVGILVRGVEPILPPPTPAGPMLLVRDEGVLLCVAIDAFAPDGSDCAHPPLDLYETRVLARATPDTTLAAGVAPENVTTVELVLDGDERVRVPTVPLGAPYASRYEGQTRFFSVRLPGERRVFGARLLGASGQRLLAMPGPDSPPLEERPVTLLRGPKGLLLSASAVKYFGAPRSFPCLALTFRSKPTEDDCNPLTGGVFEADARCSPRGLVLWGGLRRGTRLRLRTNRGLISGRQATVPRHLNPRGRRAFLLVVPPRHAPRELIVAGERIRQLPFRLPSAARQCGYTTYGFLR